MAQFRPSTDSLVTSTGAPVPGSGIILGRNGHDGVLVATARHVVRSNRGDSAVSVEIFVYPDSLGRRPIPARIVHLGAGNLDLAVLSVPASVLSTLGLHPVDFEREGEDDRLRRGEFVKGIGCANKSCWHVDDPELRFLVSEGDILVFHGGSFSYGDSGGALFDERGEVIGMMITQDDRSRAIRISSVVAQLEAWKLSHQLRRSRYPRRGYSATVGLVTLSGNASGRLPGARSTVAFQLNSFAGWHFGGLRQTSGNVSLSSGIVGASLMMRRGRLAVSPFLEVGLGQVDAQYDGGGYFVETEGGGRYIPHWRPVQGSAIGGGGGVSAQLFLIPRLAAELLVARWQFNTPQLAPSLPESSVGVGLRWALRR